MIVVASALGGAGLVAVVAALLIVRPFAGSTNPPEPSPTPSPTTRATPSSLPCEYEGQPPGPADIFQKAVPISINLERLPPPGYESSVPELEVETVVVMGTQDRVTLVTQAVATLDLGDRTEDLAQEVCLEPKDSRGFLVEGVSLVPSVVNISVKITQAEVSRELEIRITMVGTPADGYSVGSRSVEPWVVTVFGPQSIISEMDLIRTQPVDITGADDDVVSTVSLDLPADVSVSGSTSVTVTVNIVWVRTIGVTATAVGLNPKLRISGGLPLVEVMLLGDRSILEAIEPTDIEATLNLSGRGVGKHVVTVSVSPPIDGLDSWASTPQAVLVTLEET